MNERLKRIFFGTLSYFWACGMGLFIGGSVALLDQRIPTQGALAGGFAHSFPGDFSLSSLADAFFWQFFPLILLWYAAFGRLFRKSAVIVLLIRGILSGYWLVKASLLFANREALSLLLLLMLWLLELLSLCLCAACGQRGEGFSCGVLKNGVEKRAFWRFTEDVVFYFGLILFFYIARGCVVALLNI